MSESVKDPDFLVHNEGDSLGVAVKDLAPSKLRGAYLTGDETLSRTTPHDIPLGHKVALKDIEEGEDIIEYGVRVGVATQKISDGDYVHVHNIRSARWLNSVA